MPMFPHRAGLDRGPRPCRGPGLLLCKWLHVYTTGSLSSPPSPSASLHHWPGKDCHHLRSLWHQVTGDLLYQPSYSLFSSITSGLGLGFPGCEIFVPDGKPLESGTKPPVCQQLQGSPKPLILVTPATCLIWLGEESSQRGISAGKTLLSICLFFTSGSSPAPGARHIPLYHTTSAGACSWSWI